VLGSRRAFLALMFAGIALKVLLSMVVPVSFDLREIFLMATGQIQVWGPWTFVEGQMLSLWQSLTQTTSIPQVWWNNPPFSMPIALQFLSLVLRLPALSSDLAVGSVLYLIVRKASSIEHARFASLFWFLNPYTLFAVEILGVPDAATTLMVVLTSLLIMHKRTVLSGIAFAGGVTLKLFPLLLLPAFLILPSGVRDRGRRYGVLWVVFALLGSFAYFAWAMPELRAPIGYSPIAQPLDAFFTALPATKISISLAAFVIICFWMYEFAKSRNLVISDLVLPTLLLYFTFSDPYPQYFVWVLPFLILDATLIERRHILHLVALEGVLFANWFFFSQGFLAPNNYSFLLFPLRGRALPPFLLAIQSLLKTSTLMYLLLNAALYATTLIYSFEIIRGWSRPHSSVQKSATSQSRH
jgi:hypothetical protein